MDLKFIIEEQTKILRGISDRLAAREARWRGRESTVAHNSASIHNLEVAVATAPSAALRAELDAQVAATCEGRDALEAAATTRVGALVYCAAPSIVADNWGGLFGGDDSPAAADPTSSSRPSSSSASGPSPTSSASCRASSAAARRASSSHATSMSSTTASPSPCPSPTPAKFSMKCPNIFLSSNEHHARDDGPVFDALGNADLDGRHLLLLGRREQAAVAGDVDVRPGPAERAAGVALEPGVDAADVEDVEEPHPNVTAMHDVYEDARGVHMVLELCSGGELFDRIMGHDRDRDRRYSELDAAGVVRQISRGLQARHGAGVVHRVLKPEICLFDDGGGGGGRGVAPPERWRSCAGACIAAAPGEADGLRRALKAALWPRVTYCVAGWIDRGDGVAEGASHAVRVSLRVVDGGAVCAEPGRWTEIKGTFRLKKSVRAAEVYVQGAAAGALYRDAASLFPPPHVVYESCRPSSLAVQMESSGATPDRVTLVAAVTACSRAGDLSLGRRSHSCMDGVFGFSLPVADALLDMYTKNSYLEEAVKMFEQMPERNTISWIILVSGYGIAGQWDKARVLFYQCTQKDLILWTAMINACVQHGSFEEALTLFQDMQLQCVEPDKFTVVTLQGWQPANYFQGHGRVVDSELKLEAYQMKQYQWEQEQVASMKEYIGFGPGSAKLVRGIKQPWPPPMEFACLDLCMTSFCCYHALKKKKWLLLQFLADQGAEHFFVMVWDRDANNSLGASCISRRGECQVPGPYGVRRPN